MTTRLDRLCMAMALHEGWKPSNSSKKYAGSRSWRNHNPGNLRSSPFACGDDEGFAVFRSDFIGALAMQWDIIQKIKGNTSTGLGPERTIGDLILMWAPPTDGNNHEAYVKAVEERSGLSRTMKLKELMEE